MNAIVETAYALDPALLMEAARMTPDAWQTAILRKRHDRLLLNCTRQAGKSTVVASMAVDEAMRGNHLILAICPSERQSKLLIEKTKEIYQIIGGKLDAQRQSTTHLEFPTGADMWALPSKEANIRGFSAVKLMIIDEAARVPDVLYRAVRPMLAVSQGRLVCLSTPFGKRGFFHEEWTKGKNWQRVQITAPECPRITSAFLSEEKSALPESWYRQEYFCEFADTDGAVFSYEDVMAALSDEIKPLFADAAIPEDDEVRPLFA